MPGVDIEAAVCPVRETHHLTRRRHVGDPRPRQPFKVHEQPVLGGAVAEQCERLGPLVDAPRSPEDVDGVERTGPYGFGHAQEVVFTVAEHVHGVELGRDVDLAGTRCPPPGRVDFGHHEAVVVEHGAHLGIAVAVAPGPGVVPPPQRYGAEPGVGGDRKSLAKARVARDRARAQHERVRAEHHWAPTAVNRNRR